MFVQELFSYFTFIDMYCIKKKHNNSIEENGKRKMHDL